MLKTISAALLAASVIAAPAFAMNGKTTSHAPAAKADQMQTKAKHTSLKSTRKAAATAGTRTGMKAAAKFDSRSKAMNANAAIGSDEAHKVVRPHRHHHKMVSAKKQLKTQPDATGKTAPAVPEKRS